MSILFQKAFTNLQRYFEHRFDKISEYQEKTKDCWTYLEYMFCKSHATSQAQSPPLGLPNTFANAECLCICDDQLMQIQVL